MSGDSDVNLFSGRLLALFLVSMDKDYPSAGIEKVEQSIDIGAVLIPQFPDFTFDVLDQRLSSGDIPYS